MIRKTALAILLATPFIAFASEHAKPKADIARGKVLAETICVACHGADGNSPASTNPHLAPRFASRGSSSMTAPNASPRPPPWPPTKRSRSTEHDWPLREARSWWCGTKPPSSWAPTRSQSGCFD